MFSTFISRNRNWSIINICVRVHIAFIYESNAAETPATLKINRKFYAQISALRDHATKRFGRYWSQAIAGDRQIKSTMSLIWKQAEKPGSGNVQLLIVIRFVNNRTSALEGIDNNYNDNNDIIIMIMITIIMIMKIIIIMIIIMIMIMIIIMMMMIIIIIMIMIIKIIML